MSRTITFGAATRDGIILPEHYILTTTPKDRRVLVTEKETGVKETQKFILEAGERQLWRLEQGESGLKLWGKPTKDELTLCGQIGFQRGLDTMHRVIRELYDIQGAFDTAQACSLPEKDYFFSDVEKGYQAGEKYRRQDEIEMRYWLASHCIDLYSAYVRFGMFCVNSSRVSAYGLYYSRGGTSRPSYAVRPEATTKSTLLLETEGCDGSYKHPWICLSK